jgi:TonB C terminal
MKPPRFLVPYDARPPAAADAATQRRRPTTLDERSLIPAMLPIVPLNGHSNIPANLPLESIAARVVVPRDVKLEPRPQGDHSIDLPLQPTDLDERITVPQGAAPPEISEHPIHAPEELVAQDVFLSGEVQLMAAPKADPEERSQTMTAISSGIAHVLLFLLILSLPKIFPPHVPTQEETEIARKQLTYILPPEAPEPPRPVLRSNPVHVDPREIRKIAPTILPPPPTPAPKPENLPSAPVPKPSIETPKPEAPLVAKNDTPKPPVRLETPEQQPTTHGLLLPKTSPGSTIRDSLRDAARPSTPRPMGGETPLPSVPGGGGQGTAGTGMDILSDTQGVDFSNYLRRVYITVRQNWIAVFPESARLGDRGIAALEFRIMKDGTVVVGEPVLVRTSGKEPLDRAAISSVRASTPFEPLPSEFHGPYIALRFTYYYNLPIETVR